MTNGHFSSKSFSLDESIRIQLQYDKLNTKYNRLYEQLTSISLFVFASFVAYSIAYVGFTAGWVLFFHSIFFPILLVLIPLAITFGILTTLLARTALQLHDLLKHYTILP